VSAVADRRYKGRLVRVIPMGDRSRGTVKVDVEILDADARLFPELAATVYFLPDKEAKNENEGKTFLFVPKSAVFSENGHDHVWVVDAKQAIKKRQVEVAVSNDDQARVEKGLEAGEKVVLKPAKTLKDGEVVQVAE
jgi:multidrug efflux pump subunit AcrA (membrane-fusion protein)